MWEIEEIKEKDGKDFAKDCGVLFKSISAKTNTGIEDLFKAVGSKYINPAFNSGTLSERVSLDNKQEKVKLGDKSKKPSGGGCC